MPEGEKKTEEARKKKSSRKGASEASPEAEEPEPKPSPQVLDRDQLESLREKLQRKYH